MAEIGFPIAGAPLTTVDDWRRYFSKLMTTGVWSGFLNGLAVSADGSGMTAKVDTGGANVQGFYYENTALLTKTITTAHATLPRIDTVVVKLDLTAGPPNTFAVAVKAGTPNASPVAPTLTQTTTVFEFALGDVRVNAAVGTITADKVTDRRAYAVPNLSPSSITGSLIAAGAVDATKLAEAYQKVGTADTDTTEVKAYEVSTDTRQGVPTYNGDGSLSTLVIKNAAGSSTVATITVTYNGDGSIASVTKVAGGKTAVTTYSYSGGQLAGWTRSVT